MASKNWWRGAAELIADDGQFVLPVRVVLNYHQRTATDSGRWRIVIVVLKAEPVPDLRNHSGATYTLRLSDGHESRVFLHDANPANPRHPSMKPADTQPLFAR